MKKTSGGIQILEQVVGPTVGVLQALNESSAVFPPLKAVCGLVLFVTKSMNDYHLNSKQWRQFQDYLREEVEVLARNLADARHDKKMEEDLNQLLGTLEEIQAVVADRKQLGRVKRYFNFMSDPGRIAELRTKFKDSMSVFNLSTMLKTHAGTTELVSLLSQRTKTIAEAVEKSSDNFARQLASDVCLNILPSAPTSSFDSRRQCLNGTRTDVLTDIFDWVHDSDCKKPVYLLSGPSGSGKSAISHTVATKLQQEGISAAHYFYSSKPPEDSSHLVTTLAKQIATFHPDLRQLIIQTIQQTANIRGEPIDRQFDKLILKPLLASDPSQKIVIFIDDLEREQDFSILAHVVEEKLSALPSNVRFFLTCAEGSQLKHGHSHSLTHLTRLPHFRGRSIDIHAEAHRRDIATYMLSRLRTIAKKNQIDRWPRKQPMEELQRKTLDLFSEAKRLCDKIEKSDCPEEELKGIIADVYTKRPTARRHTSPELVEEMFKPLAARRQTVPSRVPQPTMMAC